MVCVMLCNAVFQERLQHYNTVALPVPWLCLQAPGAWAHAPLQERLAELKVPVTIIYGEHDWMNPAAGQAVAQKLDQIRPRKVGALEVLRWDQQEFVRYRSNV